MMDNEEMNHDKPDIEQLLFNTLESRWDIPRSVKNAFLHEWNNDRPGNAIIIMLLWQIPLCILTFIVVNTLLEWLL